MHAIDINVGGCIYTTSINTLTKFPESILAKIVNGTLPYGKDKNSLLFIDRDGDLFKYVLQFLRADNIDLSRLHREQIEPVLWLIFEEAKFYNIRPLILYVENELKKR